MHPDELYMSRALELAERGAGSVSPNPMVGCVIVKEGEVIGEGWHQKFGSPHAEVEALRNIEDRSKIQGSTVYVSLEPCSHYGKTPPCTDLLIREKVGKVIIGCKDPNPVVNGKGIDQLINSGIAVEISKLAAQALELNRRFFTSHLKQRPYIIIKWAQTADGFIARKDYSSKWISGELSRQWVHRWRAEEDAVLIGRNTAEKDNASLTVRDWTGLNPIRILILKNGLVDASWKIFDQSAKTICYYAEQGSKLTGIEVIHIQENFIPSILSDLKNRGILSVIVEGGATTLNSFIKSGLWDEARIFTSPVEFDEGISAPGLESNALKISEVKIGPDTLTVFRHPDSLFSNGQTVK